MAQLNERKIVEFELSSSTEENKKWIKAYFQPSLPDLAVVQEAQKKVGEDAIYTLLSRLIIDWSYYDGSEKAPVTPENVALIGTVDQIEISEHLDIESVMQKAMSTAKKKN